MAQCTAKGCPREAEDPRFRMCVTCRCKQRERTQTPAAKAKRRAWRRRPDVKARDAASSRRFYATHKERLTAERKAIEAERLSAGLCTRCGIFLLDKPGIKTCMDCRQDKADYHARPAVKARKKEYMKEYEQRPRTKAYRKASLPARREYAKRYRQTNGYFEMLARAAERERKSEKRKGKSKK